MQDKEIVIIQKDKILNSILELFIEDLGYRVSSTFSSFNESASFIKSNNIHTLIIDINAFDNRISIYDEIKTIKSLDLPIIIIGNKNDTDVAELLTSNNIYSFMSKPINKNILKINLDIAFSQHQENRQSRYNSGNNNLTADCTFDKSGIITAYSPSFLGILNIQTVRLNKDNIKDLFTESFYFVDIDRTIKKINNRKLIESTFLYQNIILKSELTRNSENTYKLHINKSNITGEIIYEKDILSQKFHGLFNNSDQALLIFNVNDEMVEFNASSKNNFQEILNKELFSSQKVSEILDFIPIKELNEIIKNTKIPSSQDLDRSIKINGKLKSIKLKFIPLYSDTDSSVTGYIVSLQDISTVTDAVNELSRLKDELKPIYESSIQRFYLIDKNHRIIIFNEAAQKIIQKEHNHTLIKGDSILQFVPKEIGEITYIDSFSRVLKGEHITFNNKFIVDSEEHWNEVHYEPVVSKNGELNRVLIWTLDITEGKKNLIALKESNIRHELIAKSGNDGILDWDMINNTIYLSPKGKYLLGYNDSDIQNKIGLRKMLLHPDDYKTSKFALDEFLLSNNDSFVHEARMICKNQESKWIRESLHVIRDDKGKALRMIGSLSDISQKKESETKLIDLNNALLEERSMLSKGDIGIIRVDAVDVTNIIYVSENTAKIIGYSASEFYNKKVPFDEIIYQEDRKRHNMERMDAFNNNASYIDFEHYRLIKKDGTIIWVKDFTNIIRNSKGEAVSLLGYIIDITKEKELERDLNESQNMFSALWQNITYETFIVQKDGQILFSRNNAKYSISKLLTNKYYIYKIFKNLSDWNEVINTIYNKLETHVSIDEDKQISVSKIDNEKILISTNLTFSNLDE